MINLLEQSWQNEQLPIISGIVKNNGLYYQLERYDNSIQVKEPVSFSFDFSGDNFSEIDSLFEMKIEEYTLYCGEGSLGGDGFIYIENTETKKMLWCVFSDFINPIVKCKIAENKLIAENNNHCQYIFEFENPEELRVL